MGRDRFVKTEWGDKKTNHFRSFGFCDHGQNLSTREEKQLYDELKAEGWAVHKHGWPDFMATKGEEVRLIEVKSNADRIRQAQLNVHRGFAKKGDFGRNDYSDQPSSENTYRATASAYPESEESMTNRIGTCWYCGGPITDETPSIQRHCRLCGTVATPPEPSPATRIEDNGLSRIGDGCLRFQTWSLRD